jgi:hypothetical protein
LYIFFPDVHLVTQIREQVTLDEEAVGCIGGFLDILFLVGFPKLGNFAEGSVLFHNDNELKSKVPAITRDYP